MPLKSFWLASGKQVLKITQCLCMLNSPWHNRNGWLGIKHQVTATVCVCWKHTTKVPYFWDYKANSMPLQFGSCPKCLFMTKTWRACFSEEPIGQKQKLQILANWTTKNVISTAGQPLTRIQDYYFIREIKTWLSINHITVHNNTFVYFKTQRTVLENTKVWPHPLIQ